MFVTAFTIGFVIGLTLGVLAVIWYLFPSKKILNNKEKKS
jgi:hypothetical protein